jgi:rhamnosyltransferase
MSNKVYALVSIYHPNAAVIANVRSISEQVDKIFLCDNSGTSNAELFKEVSNSEYVFNGGNLGIPTAFNRILKNNRFSPEDFIIFFDQDSCVKQNHIEKLIQEYEALEQKGVKVGCLGPEFYNVSNGTTEKPTLRTDISDQSYIVNNIITSSMLCKYNNLAAVGFWNEKLFLDFCDWDICWRLKKAGYKICMTSTAVLQHKVGIGDKKVGFRKVRVSVPIREYYQVRDALFLLHENYVPLKMRLVLLKFAYVLPLQHILLLDDKESRKTYIRKGFSDYKKRIYGEIN